MSNVNGEIKAVAIEESCTDSKLDAESTSNTKTVITEENLDRIVSETKSLKRDARRNYDDKRIIKPVSFLKEADQHLLSIVSSMEYGTWVKGILKNFTGAEISLFKANPKALIIPSALVEKSIEDGLFDLDEYLRERGLIAVPRDSVKKSTSMQQQNIGCDYDPYNQDISQESFYDVNQDFNYPPN